ncbi:uncharacterized protein LOC134445588 [Engraulis encrasicolus]|uniref:uncharacterized protein LOC134445588 n=1 Tax=Engraulis encrasicolus TaxID=184585 RepID=UPI002FD449E3
MTNVTLLFEGEDDHLLPSTSESIIDIDLFIVAGRIIGHSFLHGGPPLYGLSEAVVQMVVQGTADMSSMTVRDVADFDLRGTIKMLDGEAELTGAEVDQINQLALSWDLPPLSSGNRQYLYQKLLKHAVLVRRSRQVKQIRKGLKETNVLPMLKERPDTAEVLFPRAASAVLTAQAILSHVVWPGKDDDSNSESDRDSDSNTDSSPKKDCRAEEFLRRFIETASATSLLQLVQFWTGWNIPTGTMTVKIEAEGLLKASTCFTTLYVPGHFQKYHDFYNHVAYCISTSNSGFGQI